MTDTKIIVLDDDPTGSQTVHSCLLVTRWDEDTLKQDLLDDMGRNRFDQLRSRWTTPTAWILRLLVKRLASSLWTDTNINATETVYPRVVGNLNTDGSALTTHTNIVLAGERLKIVIAQGGASHSGTFTCIVRGR